MIAELFRLFTGGFEETFEKIDHNIRKTLDSVEEQVDLAIRKVQRKIAKFLIQIALLVGAFSLIIAGTIIFLLRFFPMDLVFVGSGVVLLYVVLMIRWMK